MGRLAPRMKINKDRTVTVAGIPYLDFRMLLTQATLGLFDAMERHKDAPKEDQLWVARMRAILEMLENPPYRSGVKDKSVLELKPYERSLRWRDVKDERSGRLEIEEFMSKFLNEDASH